MNLSAKNLIKFLEVKGLFLNAPRVRINCITTLSQIKRVIVPVHGGKDIKKDTFLAILKQAGLDKNFFS